ncbi:MAG: hypothetical protein HYY23_19940 [Verrucomicrobia bacterium]|nr:hypothetical protein [Verrucomicrobiota bacterium]
MRRRNADVHVGKVRGIPASWPARSGDHGACWLESQRYSQHAWGAASFSTFTLEWNREKAKSPGTMKQVIRALVLAAFFACCTLSVRSDDLSKLEGKWSVKKTNNEGQTYTQVLEIQKAKFKFKLVGADNQTHLYAEGDIKLSKLGPFSAIKFFNIKGGASADQLEPVDDDREAIYMLEDNRWTLATNFDKAHDGQRPAADTYARENK